MNWDQRLDSFPAIRYWSPWGSYWAENYIARLSIPLLLQKHTHMTTVGRGKLINTSLCPLVVKTFSPKGGVYFHKQPQHPSLRFSISNQGHKHTDYKLCMQRVQCILLVSAPTSAILYKTTGASFEHGSQFTTSFSIVLDICLPKGIAICSPNTENYTTGTYKSQWVHSLWTTLIPVS